MSSPHKPLHNHLFIEEGQTVGEVIPAFSDVRHEVHLGEPNKECASCRKPFNSIRKPRKSIRLYPVHLPIPMAFSFRICGCCAGLYRQGGEARDGVAASLVAYFEGIEVTQ